MFMNDVPTQLTHPEFQSRFEALLGQLSKTDLIDYAFVEIPSNRKPWLDSGISLAAGESVTTFSIGQTRLIGTDLWFGADFQVWFRVGTDGEIFRGTRASNSFQVSEPGHLYLGSNFPGEWSTTKGQLNTPEEAYEQVSGVLGVLIIRWNVAPLDGLKKLAGLGDVANLVAGEIERLTNPILPPQGWHYLWFLGPAEIYRPARLAEKKHAICCETHRDVGLLLKDKELPFKPDTCLHWDWRMEVLPSEVREDSLPTHDYLSIAVEFDNGQDITYYWSAELPVNTAYRCPIPGWHERETHVVIRTGSEGLGQWFSEKRDVYQDYQNHIGGELPTRIIRVWLIALSLFQGREGKCQYDNIYFAADGKSIPVQ
jgi:hypothetical protein